MEKEKKDSISKKSSLPPKNLHRKKKSESVCFVFF